MQFNRKTLIDKSSWQPPSHGFLKFNIDRASKGNPGEAGYRGVLRDNEGNKLIIFHISLRDETNNILDLMVMESCLEVLFKHNIHNVIIEVDLELVINSVKRINVGATPEKILEHWQLLQVYQRI